MKLLRRTLMLALLLLPMPGETWPIAQVQAAAPAARTRPGPASERAVDKRLALWQRPAAGAGLSARYQLSRSSSLLYEPLRAAGSLTFTAPDQLELRGDPPGGVSTRLSGAILTIVADDPALPPAPGASGDAGGAGRRWLSARLLALLLARDPAALLADTQVSVPRGPGMQLELSPGRTHPALRELLRLRVQLDPGTGEIVQLQLHEANGDLVTLTLAEHRRSG